MRFAALTTLQIEAGRNIMSGCGHKWLVETDAGTRGRGEIFWTSPTRFDRTL
ncbi:MAG TPA: hypothetical protein V6D26_17600 [Stenomitos sp.]